MKRCLQIITLCALLKTGCSVQIPVDERPTPQEQLSPAFESPKRARPQPQDERGKDDSDKIYIMPGMLLPPEYQIIEKYEWMKHATNDSKKEPKAYLL